MCLFQSCGLLPTMDAVVSLLLKTMIMREGDIEHDSTAHTAKISAAASERFKNAGWENFDKYNFSNAPLRCCVCIVTSLHV